MEPKGPNSFKEATIQYRSWMDEKITVIEGDWAKRLQKVTEGTPFEFLRATFYRWSQWWPVICEELDNTPLVLGVGDLHVENFGTWRDVEGRLVWGINDFDECCCLPYTQDLVRLATSTLFAIAELEAKERIAAIQAKELSKKDRRRRLQEITENVDGRFQAACRSILAGYSDALDPARSDVGRQPFLLAEREGHSWLREIVLNKLRTEDQRSEFDKFLQELVELPNVDSEVPLSAWEALSSSMPEPGIPFRIGKRDAGLGSLGRQRFTAVVPDWRGGILAREVKALVPSAWLWWTEERQNTREILYGEALNHAVRARDPWVRIFIGEKNWVVRRLAPDAGKVKLKDLPRESKLEDDLLRAMGHETANVHVALGDVWRSLAELKSKDPDWLYHNASAIAGQIAEDWGG